MQNNTSLSFFSPLKHWKIALCRPEGFLGRSGGGEGAGRAPLRRGRGSEHTTVEETLGTKTTGESARRKRGQSSTPS